MNEISAVFSVIAIFTLTSFLVGLLLALLLFSLEDLFFRKQLNRFLVESWFRRKLRLRYTNVTDFSRRNGNAFSLPPRQLVGLMGSSPESSLSGALTDIGKRLMGYREADGSGPPAREKSGDLLDEMASSSVFIERALDDLQAFLEKNWITSRYIGSFFIAFVLALTFASIIRQREAYEHAANFNLLLILLGSGALFAPVFRELLQRLLGRRGP